MSKLTVSLSPHFQNPTTTRVLMNDVLIALGPVTLMSLLFYGWNFLMLLIICVATCIVCEFAIEKYLMGREIPSMSATCLTGVLLALNLPPAAPWWVAFLGSIAAIAIAKMCFGGLGQNIFNPAIFGRVFLLVAFPAIMTTWAAPQGWLGVDAFSGATPLAAINEGLHQGLSANQIIADNGLIGWHMLFARAGGSAGEISALALIAGFIYLLVTKTISWRITLSTLASFFVTAWLLKGSASDALISLMSGGILFGAVYMATDYATSPMLSSAQLVYGVGIGVITMIIRQFGSYPEGVTYAILLMNIVAPLLDRYMPHKIYGVNSKKKEVTAK